MKDDSVLCGFWEDLMKKTNTTTNTWGTRAWRKYEIRSHKNLSESSGRTWVSVWQRKSRSFYVTISARSDPYSLQIWHSGTPSVRGTGLRDTPPPSRSNNITPLPLTKVENLLHEQEYEIFLATLINEVFNVLDTLVWNHSYLWTSSTVNSAIRSTRKMKLPSGIVQK